LISQGLGIRSFAQISSGSGVILPSPSISVGTIIHWPLAVALIPAGWALCDGTVYASLTVVGLVNPDMRGLFAKAPSGTGPGGTIGGSDTHTHANGTLLADLADSHSHGGVSGLAGTHSHGGNTGNAGSHDHTGNTADDDYSTHGGLTGAGTAHWHLLNTVNTGLGGGHQHLLAGSTGSSGVGTNTASVAGNISADHVHSLSGNTFPVGDHTHSYTIGQAVQNESAHMHPIVSVLNVKHTIALQADHLHVINNQDNHSHNISVQAAHTHSISGSLTIVSNVPAYKELHFMIKV